MEDRLFSPRDLLTAAKWSSLLFTTYSLSLSFLESVPLAAVNRSYKNFSIITDLDGYLSSLSDVGAIGVGREYDLVPVRVRGGVFHPKIALLADDDGNVRATVGSGNLSFGGWGYNQEVLELLRPGRDSRCFSDLADMLENLSNNSSPGGKFEFLRSPGLSRFVDMARRAGSTPGDGRSRLLHTIDGPLVPQIAEMAEELGGARSLVTVSPFFSTFNGVKALAEGLGCDDVSVAVALIAPSIFDFQLAADAGFSVKAVSSEYFDYGRPLHSKLFDIACARGRLVVTGSANATTAALLGRNIEAVVVRPTELSVTFGWEPTLRRSIQTIETREPEETINEGLVLDYNGGAITGRVFGTSGAGEWQAVLTSSVRRQSAGLVIVDASGFFKFTPPPGIDPISLGSSAQVIFIRGTKELRGWLVIRDIINAISRRGPIARSIGRLMSGLDTLGDVGAILEYFANDPETLFDASERTGGGKKARESAVRPIWGSVSSLGGTSALDMDSTWTGGESNHSGDALIDALVRHLAEVMPLSNDDGADDEDDPGEVDQVSPSAKSARTQPPKRAPRLQKPIVERAFSQLFEKLEALPLGAARAPGLFVVFDMMIQIVPRTEASDELLPVLLRRWLWAASKARPTDTDTTTLDQCFCVIATRLVIDYPALAPQMHHALQSWIGGELDDEFKILFEPAAGGLEERRIYPVGTAEEWQAAWLEIVTSRTLWSAMNELRMSIAVGGQITVPAGADDSESRIILKVAKGNAAADRISYMSERRTKPNCPRCHTGLPAVQASRLKRGGIATCTNIRCNRVVIDVSL